MPYQRNRIEVKVPNRSGANMSHRNSGTINCGTLTPLLVEEVIPNTRVHLKIPEVVQLPPLVSDTYMNLKLKHEAFFVPFRILCSSFEQYFSDFPELMGIYSPTASVPTKFNVNAALPVITFDDTVLQSVYGAGTLLDYLGFKVDNIAQGGTVTFSPLSLVAYHLIWQEYYRNPRVQSPAFLQFVGNSSNSSPNTRIASLPYLRFTYGVPSGQSAGYYFDNYNLNCSNATIGNFTCADGVSLFALRQRNFGLDWFTGARPSPQQGNPSSVTIQLPSGATETSFTIAQLRAANSLQQFRERNNLPSPRMVDQVRARYGANLSDGVAQRPICIGSSSFDVVSRGVDQTSPGSSIGGNNNPFNTVGSNYGKAYAVGSGTLIDDFTANEPGFIIVLQSLVPEVTYSTGVAPYLSRYNGPGSIVDMAVSTLQNVGDEPIYQQQLTGALGQGQNTAVFAYNDRYGTFLFHSNEVHGLLRDGESLDAFVLQRSFFGVPAYGTQFLEIPTNYLDQAFVTSAQQQGFAAWYDAKLEWKISTPLAELSLPSLQDPAYEHGQSVSLIRNGQIF